MESVWLNCLIFHLCSIINFLSRRHFLQEILPRLVEKIKQFYVFQGWQNAILQLLALTFKCPKGHMICLL
jgi:hypothetical protein